jgi:thioredoxin-related protein
MKFLLTIFICLFYLPIVFGQQNTPATINWMTWDEAVAQSKIDEKPKKVFIDFYTAWCGWCKRMDATTFANPTIADFMNKNYYPIKFDAEGMDTIAFRGTTFMNSDPSYLKTGARGKVHILAYSLLEGALSYPSYTILDEDFNRVHIIGGYKQPDALLASLLFFSGEEYKHYHNYVHAQWQRNLKLQQAGQK